MSNPSALIQGLYHSGVRSRRHDRLTDAALIIASLHPHALDYIQQAPVLVLPAAQRDPAKPKHRESIERTWAPVLSLQPKLPKLLEHFELAPQLRALYGCNLQPRHLKPLRVASTANPSTLAQAIPDRIGRQKSWLACLLHWTWAMEHHRRPLDTHIEWAVREFSGGGSAIAGDLADFAARSENFNPRWTLVQAREASSRWHAELARTSQTDRHRTDYGLGWSDPLNYGILPVTHTIGAYEFRALRSGEDLFNEGRTMHNCVASYFGAIFRAQSRIYSIRKDGAPIATLELTLPLLGMRQVKGPCNAVVPPALLPIITRFIRHLRKLG